MGYPVRVEVEGERVVVVGGGGVAARRVRRLDSDGADVTVVAPSVEPQLAEWAESGRIDWREREYEKGDLAGARLVFAATDDPVVQSAVAEEADDRDLPVNIADRSAEGDFSVPAVAEFGGLRISIDTGGASPALAGALRRHLEQNLEPAWSLATAVLGALRDPCREFLESEQRHRLFRELVAELPDVLESASDDWRAASETARAAIEDAAVHQWLSSAGERAGVSAEALRRVVESATSD